MKSIDYTKNLTSLSPTTGQYLDSTGNSSGKALPPCRPLACVHKAKPRNFTCPVCRPMPIHFTSLVSSPLSRRKGQRKLRVPTASGVLNDEVGVPVMFGLGLYARNSLSPAVEWLPSQGEVHDDHRSLPTKAVLPEAVRSAPEPCLQRSGLKTLVVEVSVMSGCQIGPVLFPSLTQKVYCPLGCVMDSLLPDRWLRVRVRLGIPIWRH